MGLTVHYSFHHPSRNEQSARSLVERLHRKASDLPFESVSEVLDLRGDECDYENVDHGDSNRWLLIQSRQLLLPLNAEVKPTRLFAFSAWPGLGSEPMNVGLGLYSGRVTDGSGRVRATKLSGWRWSSFCKTQYASDPSLGDVANFVRCHLSVVHLLDHAKELGVLDEVSDEGDYFEGRDVEALIREVTKWNEQMAGLAGFLKDKIGGDLKAAITQFTNFEHLEARGRRDEDAG